MKNLKEKVQKYKELSAELEKEWHQIANLLRDNGLIKGPSGRYITSVEIYSFNEEGAVFEVGAGGYFDHSSHRVTISWDTLERIKL